MNLENLFPEKSKFYIRSVNRWFYINPVTMKDEIWLINTYGDKLEDIFKNINMIELCRVVFQLLDIKDKKFLKKQEVDFVNENGDISSKEIGGVDLLLSLVSGDAEKIGILNAVEKVFQSSRPEIKDDDKKKVQKILDGN